MIERMQQRRRFGRIRQVKPSNRYQAAYTHNGRLYKAEHTFAAREDAEGWLHERRKEIDRDLWSPPATADQKGTAKQKKAAEEKFRDYAKRWVETRTVRGRPLKPRTKEHYTAMLDDYLIPAFGNKAVRDITMESVDRWYAKTLTDKPTMRAHAYSLLRTILETARTRDRLIDTNPCLIRGAGNVARKIKPQPASVEELSVIVAAMPARLQAMTLLAAWTALRFGELVELRRSDVELIERTDAHGDTKTEGLLKIRRAAVRVGNGWEVGDPKSEAGKRDVAIPPHVVPAVKHHLAEHVGPQADALLFPAQSGGHLQPSSLYRSYYKARAAAKREDLRFHDLRGTGATLAAYTGATLAELQARLGHSTPQAAMRYQHATHARDRILAEKLSALVSDPPHKTESPT